MKLQRLYSLVRQALQDYDMIQDGDKVAVGISGGKDSLTLLYALAGLKRFYPKKFEVVAITVSMGYQDMDLSSVAALCKKLEVPFYVVDTRIKDMIGMDNPCSLCARFRRGALNQKAIELGCNLVAYGHHMDDVVDTMMLSLIYEGRFSSFWPVTKLEENLTVIRPMIYVKEADVIGFKNKMDLPVMKNLCPFDKHTEREYVHELIREINLHAPGVKDRMMTALTQSDIKEWQKKGQNGDRQG